MNPPENRVLAFLTSHRNLVGVVLALLGVGAYLLGFLGAWWLPITLGLYLIGVLVTPATPRETLKLPETASAEELRRNLDRYVKMLRGHLGKCRSYIATVWGIGYKFDPDAVR